MTGNGVRFRSLDFVWEDGTSLARGLDLQLEAGEITALLGPSGCGKSTLLRLAAGLLVPTGGRIECSTRRAFVFQKPTLLAWRTVRANVELPLELGGEQGLAIDEALELVGLAEHGAKLPHELSGGMQMRASLARALVTSPDVLLMDEPFAALDALTRRRLQRRFVELQAEAPKTVLWVTHDIDEACLLADRVVVLAGPDVSVVLDERLSTPRPRSLHTGQLGGLATRLEGAL
ncbi:MAG: ABC transporter ATP-binding protein [Proteobacteria bacterium]|nr:ABC transporter ATP-binding protein [Pseudomonadota bacterium]